MPRTITRRRALAGTGAVVTGLAVPVSGAESDDAWQRAETPTDRSLHATCYAGGHAYAVGGGGIVLRRDDDGWTRVLDGGPTGNGNDLFGAAVAGDGDTLWFVGASGAIGEYDTATGNLVDRSAPNDHTNNFNDVAVTGTDDADVYVADDSGAVHYSFDGGEEGTWEYATPGSGAGIRAIDFHDARAGRVVDGDASVYETGDGETWTKIGLEDADVSLYGLASTAPDEAFVSGGSETVHRYDGERWRTESFDDADLRALDVAGDFGVSVGSGGILLERVDGAWRRVDTDTGQNLLGVTTGPVEVAVGAGGTVLERR